MDEYHIYLISGMGLDERLFFKMSINAPHVHHINWIEPLAKEDIEDYARRMMQQIKHRGNIILIGVSFGGMMAIELSKILRVEQVIIVSSIKQKEELPFLLKIAKYFPVYYLTTPKVRQTFRRIWGNFFGLFSQEAFDFFDDMFEKHSAKYKTWAVNRIANWKNETYPKNLVHIHGSKDMIFPIKKIQDAIIVEGGTHGIIVNKAEEVSQHINEVLNRFAASKAEKAIEPNDD